MTNCNNIARYSIIIIAVLLLAPASAFTKTHNSFGPFTMRTQNPVYLQVLGLTPQRANVLPNGALAARVDAAYSSVFHVAQSSNAVMDMDMEFLRLALWAQYGLGKNFELGVEVPMVHFGSGILDGFIQSFHNFFGLPNNGRENYPSGRYSYSFTADFVNRFNFPPAEFGLGDIALHFKNQLMEESERFPAVSWFASLKFPTGRKGRGFGSGTPDFGMGVALESSFKRLHGFFNAGYYMIGGNDDLDGFMRNQALEYMVAGEVTILPTWTVLVQLYGGTPLLMGTGIDQWDSVPLDLVVGFKGTEPGLLKFGDFTWQAAFAEDVTSRGPSVDFTVFASVGVRFGKK